MSADPKEQNRLFSHQRLFVLLGSFRENGARKMLLKLTPGHGGVFMIGRVKGVEMLENGKKEEISFHLSKMTPALKD